MHLTYVLLESCKTPVSSLTSDTILLLSAKTALSMAAVICSKSFRQTKERAIENAKYYTDKVMTILVELVWL